MVDLPAVSDEDDGGGTALRERLEAFIGRPVGSGSGVSVAPDPVNQPMIRHWAAAFEDDNPIYTDPDAAAASRHGQIVAPPLMLQTWTMATPLIRGIGERGGSPVESTGDGGVLAVLDAAGYTATLASNSDFEFDRYLHLGEVITSTTVVDTISDEKQTRLGPGFFLTWVTDYHDESGERVGRQHFRILKFKPGGGA